jgi:hypothetical protein
MNTNTAYIYDPRHRNPDEMYESSMRFEQGGVHSYPFGVAQQTPNRIPAMQQFSPVHQRVQQVPPMDFSNWMPQAYPYNFGHNAFEPAVLINAPINSPNNAFVNMDNLNTGRTSPNDLTPHITLPNSPRHGPGPPIITSDKVKGPRGCNLFVFHLPNEITNWDLYLLFRKYGTILSVHIMISKTTGLSRGFGFVSYSAKDEALAAMEGMNGYRVFFFNFTFLH